MICKLDPLDNWGGILLNDMNIQEIKLILAYKLYELQCCKDVMDDEQCTAVKQVMKMVHVPVVVREKQGA